MFRFYRRCGGLHFISRLRVIDRPRLEARLRVNDFARLNPRRRFMNLAGLESILWGECLRACRKVRSIHGAAQQPDQLKVQRRDKQADIRIQSHARAGAKRMSACAAGAHRADLCLISNEIHGKTNMDLIPGRTAPCSVYAG